MKKIYLIAAASMLLAATAMASAEQIKCLDDPLNVCADANAGSTFSYNKNATFGYTTGTGASKVTHDVRDYSGGRPGEKGNFDGTHATSTNRGQQGVSGGNVN